MQVAELVRSRELLANLTLRELRGRYKRSALGWGWSLLNPLASLVIYTVVFRFFLKVAFPVGDPSGMRAFGIAVLCGLLAWNFFAITVSTSMSSLIGNSGLIKKAPFPRATLVIAVVGAQLLTFLIELALLTLVVTVVFRKMALPWLLPALVLVVLLAAFTAGIALALAGLNVYFRDLQHLWALASQLLFFASPVVYPAQYASDRLHGNRAWMLRVYDANPIAAFVGSFRNVLYDFRFPPFGRLAYLVVVSLGSLSLGLATFGRLNRRLAEEL